MTTVTKYTTSTAAGSEIDRRAERHMAEHGCGYREAWHAVLAADPRTGASLRDADGHGNKAQARGPCGRRRRSGRFSIGFCVQSGTVIRGRFRVRWVQLSIEADTFARLGMPIEEAARRAMDGNPHLVVAAKLIYRSTPQRAREHARGRRRNGAGQTPGDVAHLRAQALTDKHLHLSYGAALHQVLDDDPGLKANYARS